MENNELQTKKFIILGNPGLQQIAASLHQMAAQCSGQIRHILRMSSTVKGPEVFDRIYSLAGLPCQVNKPNAIKAMCLGLIIEAGDLFFSSGEDESDDDSSPEVSITGFAEKIVPLMSDVEFRKHFRVSRLTYEKLLMLTGRLVSNEFNGTVGRTNVCCEKQLLVALWMLATPDSYRNFQVLSRNLISALLSWNTPLVKFDPRPAVFHWLTNKKDDRKILQRQLNKSGFSMCLIITQINVAD